MNNVKSSNLMMPHPDYYSSSSTFINANETIITSKKSSALGSEGCPCINSVELFRAASNCKTPEGIPGMRSVSGIADYLTCYPYSYGSSGCKTHDGYADPLCTGDPATEPEYCRDKWCYVDVQKCKLSKEIVFRSVYFDGLELYYSYTTCNSTASAFTDTLSTEAFAKASMLTSTVPGLLYPHQFKYTETGDVAAFSGPEYYNNSIPYYGALIEYLDKVVEFSDDIEEIQYEFRSKASDGVYPMSSFSASVRDVQAGLTDMAIGTFWLTAERLQMTAFTSPIAIDKTVLMVEKPDIDTSFSFQVNRMMMPFDTNLWLLLLATVVAVSLLSLWFASPKAENKRPWLAFRNGEWKKAGWGKKIFILNRQLLEAVLQQGMYLFSAGVEQDFRASLPHKLLMFGFSFVIVISLSAYVANLAASLTLSGVADHIDSMECAIAQNARICAHPVLKEELRAAWPKADFVYNDKTPEYVGVLEMYDLGKCDVIAASIIDTSVDVDLVNKFCDRNLVFTNGLVIEIPIAFPVKKDLAAGISHWLYDAEKELGLSYEEIYKTYQKDIKCEADLSKQTRRRDQLSPLTPQYMIFPYFILWVFAGAGVIVKLCRRRNALKAAKFIASVAHLDETTSETIVDIASFAHLNIDYSEPFDLGNVDPDKMTDNQKKEYLQRISRRVSMAVTRQQLCGDDSSKSFLNDSLSNLEDWRLQSTLSKTLSNRLLNVESPEIEGGVKSNGNICGNAMRKNGNGIGASALKSSRSLASSSTSLTMSASRGVSFDEEALTQMGRKNANNKPDYLGTETEGSLNGSLSSILFPINESIEEEESLVFPMDKCTEEGIPRLRSLASSPHVDLEDGEFRHIIQDVIEESRNMIKNVVRESMQEAIVDAQGDIYELNQEVAKLKINFKEN